MKIYIIGYMGAGKSTVGKRLANRLELSFIDLDDAFEERFRYSIPRFFDHFGEERFREFEHQCLKEISNEHDKVVIATGGGTACFHDNMRYMADHGMTIYLKMHPKSLARRLTYASRLRPVIRDIQNNDMLAFVERQLAEREVFYNQANIIVKGESLNLMEVVDMIKALKPGLQP